MSKKIVKTIEYKVRDLWNGMVERKDMREEAAAIFKSLGDKGVYYSEAEKILELLKSDKDVDNITLRIQEIPDHPQALANVIDCGSIFIHPERETRFKDLPEQILAKVHALVMEELHDKLTSDFKDLFDRLH